ncbi:MAG: carbohydrate kinase family protein [Desulfurococcales archaeon]|nr:carbohydrate kinase family protein [Desulfurococcales archaeon]
MLLATGSLNVDVTFKVPRFAPPKAVIEELTEFLGGSGGNAAVAAARILGLNKVTFLGSVGDDTAGLAHLQSLRKEGVITDYVKVVKGARSGKAYVAVRRDGETAIYSYYGANTLLELKDAEKALNDLKNTLKGLLITNPPLKVATYLSREGRRVGLKVFWDPGSTSSKGMHSLKNVLTNTDYLLPNEGEVLLMTGAQSVEEGVAALRDINPDIKVVVKKGVNGATLYLPSGDTVTIPAVHPKRLGLEGIASTTGCGDALTGVFTALIILGFRESEALRMAVIAASYNAGFPGPRNSPTLETLEALIRELRE